MYKSFNLIQLLYNLNKNLTCYCKFLQLIQTTTKLIYYNILVYYPLEHEKQSSNQEMDWGPASYLSTSKILESEQGKEERYDENVHLQGGPTKRK